MALPLPLIIAIGATAVGTGLSVYGQIESAKAQEEELERQAEERKVAAQSRELKRRQELNRILAANVVGQSMSGISGEGTPSSIALESAKQVAISEGVMALSDRLEQAQLRRQAKNVRSAGNLAAASTLLQGTAKTAQLIPG